MFKFVSIRIPRAYSDDASRRAALYPFFGPVDLSKGTYLGQLDGKVQGLIRLWRRRLEQFKAANWILALKEDQYKVCLNCHPSFMVMSPSSLVCKQSVCPFCYGRTVQDLYRSISNVCKGIPGERKTDYWLLGFRQSVTASELGMEGKPLKQLFDIETKVRGQTYRRLQSFGGYIGSELEPLGPDDWKITRRGIVLVSSGLDLSGAGQWADSVKRVKTPRGDKLAKLLGWAMKYPTKLLVNGDPIRSVRLLHEKKHVKLNASYGLFRKSK